MRGRWPAGRRQAEVRSSRTPPRPQGRVFSAKGHLIPRAIGFKHVSIRIVPRNQKRWRDRRPGAFVDNPNDDIHNTDGPNTFATLGAGSDQDGAGACGGHLKSDVNRFNDVNLPPASPEEFWLLIYAPFLEDVIITKLFELDGKFDDDDLQYECLPHPEEPE